MELQSSIKKMTLNYAKCPHGDLHSGEVMNLICVDSSCGRRGIICPICRMKNHEDHQILPLKVFLEEIKKLFVQSDDSSSLNNLSDYLRSIQNSHKQMINILREAAQSIAQQFKSIETKINENYTTIRRNVLTQSSVSTKLPNLVTLLTESHEKDAIALQEEFHKYSDLLKFENSKMNVCDKAKKLVQQYSHKPNSIKISLNEQVKTIHDKFNQIFFSKSAPPKETVQKYTFSSQHKSFQISLSDNDKKASTNEDLQNLGLVYVKEGLGKLNRKVTFEICKISSLAVSLGMGFPEKDANFAYVSSTPRKGEHFFSQCSGYNNYDNQSESEEEVDAFKFTEPNTQVTIIFEGDKNQIKFTENKTNQTRTVNLTLSDEQKKKLQFFVVLAESDEVKIVDN